jgi:hypothetical protein
MTAVLCPWLPSKLHGCFAWSSVIHCNVLHVSLVGFSGVPGASCRSVSPGVRRCLQSLFSCDNIPLPWMRRVTARVLGPSLVSRIILYPADKVGWLHEWITMCHGIPLPWMCGALQLGCWGPLSSPASSLYPADNVGWLHEWILVCAVF